VVRSFKKKDRALLRKKAVRLNLPNFLSLCRLGLVPVFCVVFFLPDERAHLWAAGIYALASITDVADGFIARKWNQITRLGRVLDPLADKLMTFSVIICIAAAGLIPVWAVVVFFCKEALMGLGALSMYHKVDDVMPSDYLGKGATAVFFVVCVLLLVFPQIPKAWATGMITGALVLTIIAFFHYLRRYLAVMGKRS